MKKMLGSSKVQPNYRITLTKPVRRKLKVEIGDIVVFIEDLQGNIIIKKAELKPV